MTSRSNQPRITGGTKLNKDDYAMAMEVAHQEAINSQQVQMKKRAINYVKAFESMFPKEAQNQVGKGFTYSANQVRTQGGVKTTTPTVNKTYRPSK